MSPEGLSGRKLIGFGAGLAALSTMRSSDLRPEFLVDGTQALWGQRLLGIAIEPPRVLEQMVRAAPDRAQLPFVIVYAFGGKSVANIFRCLEDMGLRYERDFCDCSSLQVTPLAEIFATQLQHQADPGLCDRVRALTLEQSIDNQSSIAGTWLVLELLRWLKSEGVAGDVAEAGVYQGGNAFLVLSLLGDSLLGKRYHLFDSFEGLPALSSSDPASRAGEFADVTLAEVVQSFAAFPQAMLHVGLFEQTFPMCSDDSYCLAYVDCDLYEPTRECCDFFYQRLSPGGALFFHDYWVHEEGLPPASREPFTGVRQAVDEFAAITGEEVIRFPETTHALIVRRR